MHWGATRENGVWRAAHRRRRVLWCGHDALFVAFGRFRLRLMKPWR